MDNFRTIVTATLVVLTAGTLSTPALAQNFPIKPIRIISAVVAGGPSDMRARQVAQKLSTGANVGGERPDEFAAFIRAELAKWGRVIKDARISMQ